MIGKQPKDAGFWSKAAIVAAVAALVYLPTAWSAFTNLDDVRLIFGQADLFDQPWAFLKVFARPYYPSPNDGYYRPIVNLSLLVDFRLSGANPVAYHLTNGLLHVAASLLVLQLLLKLTARKGPALLAALLFAAHPAHVASVAWIVGRTDLLVTLLALGAILFMFRLRSSSWTGSLAHLGCFALALLCKETAVCLPIIFGAFAFVVSRASAGSMIRRLAPVWGLVLAAYFAARALVLDPAPHALIDAFGTSATQVAALWGQFGKLGGFAPLQVLAAPEDVQPGWSSVCVLGLCVLFALVLYRKSRSLLAAAMALLTFPLLMALPATKSVVLENWLYLPTVGWAILVGRVTVEFASDGRLRRAVYFALSVSIATLGVRTVLHSQNYKDPACFSQAALLASPNSSIARHLKFRSQYQGPLGALMGQK